MNLVALLSMLNQPTAASASYEPHKVGPPIELMNTDLQAPLNPTTQVPLDGGQSQTVGQAHASPASFSQSMSVGASSRGTNEKLDYAKQLDDAFYNEMQKRQGSVTSMQDDIKRLQGTPMSFADVNLKPMLAFADQLNGSNTAASYSAPTGAQQRKSDVQRLQEAVMKQQNAIGDDQLAYLKQKAMEEANSRRERSMANQLNKSMLAGEFRLREKWESNPITKASVSMDDHYRRITSNDHSTPAGQMALIFNFMKMLDDGSVVRESEYAQAQKTAGILDRAALALKTAQSGDKVDDQQIKNFISVAESIMQEVRNKQAMHDQSYKALATEYGYNPNRVAYGVAFKDANNSTQDQEALAWAKANPNNPDAQAILKLNGVIR
jgi:hypothetical protein